MDSVQKINHKTGWCALCCSNVCYCSKDSLMRQVSHCLERIKQSNDEIQTLRELLRECCDTIIFFDNECDVLIKLQAALEQKGEG